MQQWSVVLLAGFLSQPERQELWAPASSQLWAVRLQSPVGSRSLPAQPIAERFTLFLALLFLHALLVLGGSTETLSCSSISLQMLVSQQGSREGMKAEPLCLSIPHHHHTTGMTDGSLLCPPSPLLGQGPWHRCFPKLYKLETPLGTGRKFCTSLSGMGGGSPAVRCLHGPRVSVVLQAELQVPGELQSLGPGGRGGLGLA